MILNEKDFVVGFGYQKIEETIEALKADAEKRLNKAKETADALMREIEVLDMELDDAANGEEGEEEDIREEIAKKQEAIFFTLQIM